MNKSLLVALCLMFSFSALAQPRSLGGPAPEPSKVLPFKPELYSAFNEFTKILRMSEAGCRLSKNVQLDNTIMDSYHRLSLKNDKGECEIDNEALSCLNTPEFKAALDKIKQDPQSISYIEQTFKIGPDSAKKVLDFFLSITEPASKP